MRLLLLSSLVFTLLLAFTVSAQTGYVEGGGTFAVAIRDCDFDFQCVIAGQFCQAGFCTPCGVAAPVCTSYVAGLGCSPQYDGDGAVCDTGDPAPEFCAGPGSCVSDPDLAGPPTCTDPWFPSHPDVQRRCCGDDVGSDFVRQGAAVLPGQGGMDNPPGGSCCALATDCVDSDAVGANCVADGSGSADPAFSTYSCQAGSWVDGNVDPGVCGGLGGFFGTIGEHDGLGRFSSLEGDTGFTGNYGDTICVLPGDTTYFPRIAEVCENPIYDPNGQVWNCGTPTEPALGSIVICDSPNDCAIQEPSGPTCYSDIDEAITSAFFYEYGVDEAGNTVEETTSSTTGPTTTVVTPTAATTSSTTTGGGGVQVPEAPTRQGVFDSFYHRKNVSAFIGGSVAPSNYYCDPGFWFGDADKGVVLGTIVDTLGNNVDGVEVRIAGNTTLSAVSGPPDHPTGIFWIANVPAGQRDVLILASSLSGETFVDKAISDVTVPPFGGTADLDDIEITRGTQECNADCTDSTGLCSAACNGLGACVYPSDAVAQTCDGAAPGLQSVAGGQQVLCCIAGEFTPREATVEVCGGSVVSTRRPVFYQGILVNMVVTVFDSSQCE